MPTHTLSQGNTLAYEHIAPSADGMTFVCFNALSGDKGMWTASIGDAVRKAGHGLLMYNLRGQAGSDYTLASFDENSIVADARALLQEIKPVRPIHVGLSIGGLFALKAHLAGGTGAAQGIVLINTLRKAGQRLDWVNDAVTRAAETGGLELLRDLFSPLLMNEEWQQQNRAGFLKPGPYTPCKPDDGALLLMKSGSTADWAVPYERVTVPTLVITGLQDRVFYNATDVDELAARLPAANRFDMADAGHMVPVERPQALAQALLDFADTI
ncbi:MAG TPA: alpha/beta hydrolase [Hyphomicrobiaceae bacterium]|nr:alpha/beta hydrolase [Hyphomicrobiaceae bacterium]